MRLHDWFFRQASAAPDRIAVVAPVKMSYGELADAALRVAAGLTTAGLRPGDTVIVSLPKGSGQLAAVLGVLAAGGAYVPVGVDQPVQRRDRIVGASAARLVLTDAVGARESWPAAVTVLDCARSRDGEPLPAPVPGEIEDLAYIIFTSGSTGEPKGVEISHRAAVNTIEDINARYAVGPSDRLLQISALDFDLSVYDIFGMLSAGGSLLLVDEQARREAAEWADAVRAHGVTMWNTVPALLDMLVIAAASTGPLPSLRLALVSGDWVGVDLPDRFRRVAPGARFIALGGATEAAIWSNAFEVETMPPWWRSIPYGYPLRNQRYRVVDDFGRDCPDWVAGELWIGGAGVAKGYRAAPELTARAFVEYLGQRWYRTGDMGRYHADGMLEFLGRRDHQVKVRGHRIELGEIEARLLEHPAVTAAVAGIVGDRTSPRLLAWVVRGADVDLDELRSFVLDRLPAALVPERLIAIDAMPLSANGKVDRAALRRLSLPNVPAQQPEPPSGPYEEVMAELWTRLLAAPVVRRTDNFFALGGNSLEATRLIEMLADRYDVRLSLRKLFAAPTLAGFAESLRRELTITDSNLIEEGVL
jgi:amino acid adenylation domain-containing protein